MEDKIEKRIEKLQSDYNSLLPNAKSWNRDRLLLMWGFASAIVASVGLSIYEYCYPKYNLNNLKLEFIWTTFIKDYYLWGLLIIFTFVLIATWRVGKIIDTNANDINKTLEVLKKEINKLRGI